MAEFKDLDLALSRQIAKKVYNVAYSTPTFVGLLLALDNFYNQSNVRVDKFALEGGNMRINFWTDLPVVRGVDRNVQDFAQRLIPLVKNANMAAGEIGASAYEFLEPEDRFKVNRLKGDKMLSNYIQQLSQRCVDAFVNKINTDMFPAINQVGGNSGSGQNFQTDRIMAFAYPLQSGYAANALTGTGSYSYLGIDLNSHAAMKAINVGTDSTTFIPTIANLRQQLIMPLRQRGSHVDIALCGTADYAFLQAQADTIVRGEYAKTIEFGGTYFVAEGVHFVYEPQIDLLPKSEIYIGDSSTLRWGLDKDGDTTKGVAVIDPVPQGPSFVALQGYIEAAFINENPRFWGRAYNTARA